MKRVDKEIDKQVYPDGCSFESSTSYHRLALEIFFYSLLLGQRAGVIFSEHYINKVEKMFEASLYCIKPDGMIPQIGDNDSGRFLIFSNRNVLEHKYLLSLAAAYFNESKFAHAQYNCDEEAFWVFGESAISLWNDLSTKDSLIEYKSFPDAGWYIIRHKYDYCLISCGRNGGEGWHSHNDKLSFELTINGQSIFVDPGTYTYTPYPEERNKFRSTAYHNTLNFDGYEQNDIPKHDMFILHDSVNITEAGLKQNDDEVFFKGEIQYSDITHKRIIIFNSNTTEWIIRDSFSAPGTLSAKLVFHLSPDLTFNGKSLFRNANHEEIATIEVEGVELIKEKYDYSAEYGMKVNAERLTAYIPKELGNKEIVTRINKK